MTAEMSAAHLASPELNPLNLPAGLRSLLPLAQKWGIADDITRERAIREATVKEAVEIVRRVAVLERDLEQWLCGSESYSETPSIEYVAFSALWLVADGLTVWRK